MLKFYFICSFCLFFHRRRQAISHIRGHSTYERVFSVSVTDIYLPHVVIMFPRKRKHAHSTYIDFMEEKHHKIIKTGTPMIIMVIVQITKEFGFTMQ